jgi:hypothetical protein
METPSPGKTSFPDIDYIFHFDPPTTPRAPHFG